MTMAPKVADLEATTDDELRSVIDAHTENTIVGLSYWLDELGRRRTRAQAQRMVKLTIAVTALTLVNAIAAIATVAITLTNR